MRDQKAEHASFKGRHPTMFGGALARLQKLNIERVETLTMFPHPATPSTSYATKPIWTVGGVITGVPHARELGIKQEKSVQSDTVTNASKDSQVLNVRTPSGLHLTLCGEVRRVSSP